MHTLGYRFQPWTDAKSIADGPSILELRARDRRASTGSTEKIRFNHRVVARRVVERGRALDGRGRAHRHGETVRLTCGFLFMCSGYYRYDEGYTPEFPGIERFARPGRPPAALARGPRLRGQAGRRDRQRRHRGDAGAGDGRDGRARDDAAALADLRRLAARRGPDRQRSLRRVLPDTARLRDRALEERARCTMARLPAQPPPAGAGQEADPQGRSSAAARRATTSTPTSSRSYNPWDQRLCLVPDGDLFEAISRRARAEIVTDRIETFTEDGIELESGDGARGRRRRHRDRPQPALPRRHRASPSTARSVDLSEHADLQGHDAQRRPELRLHARLHQRLLDAEGRPHLRVRLPAAQPHGRARLPASACRATATRRSPTEPLLDFTSGYVLRSIDKLPSRARRRPGGCARTTRATSAPSATARSTTGAWSSRAGCRAPSPPSRRSPLRPSRKFATTIGANMRPSHGCGNGSDGTRTRGLRRDRPAL